MPQGVKNLPTMQEMLEMCLMPESERSPGGGHGSPLQYSCLENSMARGAWRATVHEIGESGITERPTHTQRILFIYLLIDICINICVYTYAYVFYLC